MTAQIHLLVRSDQPENRYGPFAAELLRSEGLAGISTVDLATTPLPSFGATDVVILTRCFLRQGEIEALQKAVAAGPRLVVFQPSPRLARAFGWQPRAVAIYPGWVRFADGYPGHGSPLQTHVPLALHDAPTEEQEARVLAHACTGDWEASSHAAVVRQDVGRGQVVFFFYDLPAAVARIRFGDPELASYLTTGLWRWQHACDLFTSQVDERVVHLPQADLHGQFLARVLTDLAPWPLARLWYYEQLEHASAAVLQSDGDSSTPEQFEELCQAVEKRGGSMTFYLVLKTKLTEDKVKELRRRGHTFAPHVDPNLCADEWYFDFPGQIEKETTIFKQRFGECSVTLQCHCAPWQGYMNWLSDFEANGYRLLFAYMGFPIGFISPYMCGSGRPLPFCDHTGRVHSVWQQPLVFYDDASIKAQVEDDPALFIRGFTKVLKEALAVHHTAIPILSHPVSFSTYSSPVMEPCFDQLVEAGVPIYNGDEWVALQDRRRAVVIEQEVEGACLRLRVQNLTGTWPLMLPCAGAGSGLKIEVNGTPIAMAKQQRLGTEYACCELPGAGDDLEVCVTGWG